MNDDFSQRATEAEPDHRPDSAPSRSRLGERIGHFHLVERLGEGGFGVVYRAEQLQPIRREVALKVIKRGMDSEAVITRFEAERQALAVMEHHGIAKVLDAGVCDDGRPFFAMELVRGAPITSYCDRHELDIPHRVRLFIEVCEAVQHAHAKGVIHRDLKPSNILVADEDGRPVAKVIDFGLAKALHERLTDTTFCTQQGAILGTPAYMSPEQAELSGLDIDTRSDVYSLGVVLYELLAGRLPFDTQSFMDGGWARLQKMICESEPPKPSSRLSAVLTAATREEAAEIAAARGALAGSLVRSLRKDLDWITVRCLEKDRGRRYQTASELAEDLRRFLAGEAVVAGPPGVFYRIGKVVRRHRAPVAAAAVATVAVLAGLVGTTWGLIEARAARNQETERAAELELVAEFQQRQLAELDAEAMGLGIRLGLRDSVHAALERRRLSPREIDDHLASLEGLVAGANFTEMALDSVEEHVIERALVAVDSQFESRPQLQARLLQTVADTLVSLGRLDSADRTQRRAFDLRLAQLGPEHPDTLASRLGLGLVHVERGDLGEAEAMLSEVLRLRRETLGAEHPDTLEAMSALGHVTSMLGRNHEAEALFVEALNSGREVFGPDDPFTLTALNNVGFLYFNLGEIEKAEGFIRESLEGQRRIYGDSHRATAVCTGNLGAVLLQLGRGNEAEALFRESLAINRTALGDSHPQTLYAISNLGAVLLAQGKLGEAEPLFREALAASRQLLGDGHQDTLVAIHNMGALLKDLGRLDEAEVFYREALESRRRILGDDHPSTLLSMANTAVLLEAAGELAEAEVLLREVVDRRRRTLGDSAAMTIRSLTNLGSFLRDHGELDNGQRFGSRAVALAREHLEPDHLDRGDAVCEMGITLTRLAQFEAAEVHLLDAVDVFERSGGRGTDLARPVRGLADLYKAWFDHDGDRTHLDQALQWQHHPAAGDD